MKKFTQLALAASVAFSANAMAMQAMDDASLSATTGQDGLSIGIGISKIEIEKLYVHDNDGLADTALGGTSKAGAIYIKGNNKGQTANHGVVITAPLTTKQVDDPNNPGQMISVPTIDETRTLTSHNLADLVIDSDAGDSAKGGAFINIAAAVSGLDINIGEIGVAASAAKPTAAATSIRRGAVTGSENAILTGLTLKTGQMDANIQLGAAPQGAMIQLNTTMLGGLTIENLGIVDNSTKQGSGDGTAGNRAAGIIHLDSIQLANANGKDLTLDQKISVVGSEGADKGYLRIISTSNAHDNYVTGIRLGSATAASIGDVEIQGLQTYYGNTMSDKGAVITIRGH